MVQQMKSLYPKTLPTDFSGFMNHRPTCSCSPVFGGIEGGGKPKIKSERSFEMIVCVTIPPEMALQLLNNP
jgi:hypothetical protein